VILNDKRVGLLLRVLILAALTAFWVGCEQKSGAGTTTGSGSSTKRLKIAVIPKGTTHEFWKSVHAGAVKASRELDVDIVWKGPMKEDDLKQQIELVQSFVARRVSGIVLAPLNDKALLKSVKDAARAKIPVVVIDSGLKGDKHVSFVATDNVAAGKLAGEHMAKLLGDKKGGVLVLRYQEGSASTANREKGFIEAARKAGLDVLSDNQYGGATTETAFKAAESLLLAQSAGEGKVAGVFCPNESTTFGMLLALKKTGLAGKLKLVGFDASDKLVSALEQNQVAGLVLQDPFTMGYLGVKTMVSHLRGEKIAKLIDTGSRMVTAENMKQPELSRLLKPDLDKWLGK